MHIPMMGVVSLSSSDVTWPSGSDNARPWSVEYHKMSCLVGLLLGAMDSLRPIPPSVYLVFGLLSFYL